MSVGTFSLFGPRLPEKYLEVFRIVSDNFLTQTVLRNGQICCLRSKNKEIEAKKGKHQCVIKDLFRLNTTFLPSSGSTQLNLTSTQTKAEVSLIST